MTSYSHDKPVRVLSSKLKCLRDQVRCQGCGRVETHHERVVTCTELLDGVLDNGSGACRVGGQLCGPIDDRCRSGFASSSARDIAGKGLANPLAQFLSFARMLRYSFDQADEADLVEKAVNMALESKRTGDIMAPGCEQTGTDGMTKAVLDAMDRLAR